MWALERALDFCCDGPEKGRVCRLELDAVQLPWDRPDGRAVVQLQQLTLLLCRPRRDVPAPDPLHICHLRVPPPLPWNYVPLIILMVKCQVLQGWIGDPHQVVQASAAEHNMFDSSGVLAEFSQETLPMIGQDTKRIFHYPMSP